MPASLLARADSALYSAKAAGPNRLFVHTGTHIREHHAGPRRDAADSVDELRRARRANRRRHSLARSTAEALAGIWPGDHRRQSAGLGGDFSRLTSSLAAISGRSAGAR